MPGFGESPQTILNSFAPKGTNAIFGVHVLRAVGSGIFGIQTPAIQTATGLLNPTGIGSGGIPGVSATLVSTGLYSLQFPTAKHVDISAVVSSSSGYNFNAYVNNQSGPSGTAQLEIVRDASAAGGASGLNLIQASGFRGFLPTGTQVKLSFYAAPNIDGFTSF
jgi:hypothetical protein